MTWPASTFDLIDTLASIADLWIGRRARPQPSALAAVAGLEPIVVVTGGSTGIGLAIARRFAAAGCHVALVARTPSTLDAAAAELQAVSRVAILPIALDITQAAAGDTLAHKLAEGGYYLDVLVNSAGIGMAGAFVEGDADKLETMQALNITALTRLTRRFLPDMLARARGGILNVASLGAYTPGPYQAAYYASKAYVLSLTEAVAYEIAGRGVRCAVVAPGPVATTFHATMGAQHSPYRQAMPAASPRSVAGSAYRGYKLGRRVIVPGLIATVLMPAIRAMPHPLLLPIIATLLKPWRPR